MLHELTQPQLCPRLYLSIGQVKRLTTRSHDHREAGLKLSPERTEARILYNTFGMEMFRGWPHGSETGPPGQVSRVRITRSAEQAVADERARRAEYEQQRKRGIEPSEDLMPLTKRRRNLGPNHQRAETVRTPVTQPAIPVPAPTADLPAATDDERQQRAFSNGFAKGFEQGRL